MPVSVRNSALAAFCALSLAGSAGADGGFYLPQGPTGPGGEDSIETSSGTRCRQAINGNGAYLDVGIAGSRSNGTEFTRYGVSGSSDGDGGQALGYARMIVPLGRKPERIDCSRLYELELARLRREIELLKMAAE